MQAMAMERETNYTTQQIRDALRQCNDRGIATYKQIALDTGISRTGISQLVNHGMTMHAVKMERLAGWLAANAPQAVSDEDESVLENAVPAPQATRSTPNAARVYPTQDMQKLVGWLNTLYQHRAIGALVGPAGSGKTTILREYLKINPSAKYVKCWALMHMGDLLDTIGDAFGLTLTGSMFRRQQQLINQLRGTEAMLLLDEAEFLKTWNIKKLEVLREIWDAIGIPIVLCGTEGLERVLTRGTGRDNCAQLYRRCWQGVTSGISGSEMNDILGDYQIAQEAAQTLIKMATDHKHGGMGNAFETLRIALEIAEGGMITTAILKQAMQYKVLFR